MSSILSDIWLSFIVLSVNDINLALAMNKTEPVYGLGVSETVVGLKSTSSTSKHSDGTNIVNLGYLNKF